MIEISFAAAFVGGVLSLLSPCSALLLPAFFAYAFQNKRELTARTAVFFAGLATIFVPLGMGASLATTLFQDHRDTMIIIAGGTLIAFGVMELLGRTFSFGPGAAGDAVTETRGLFGTYTLGLVYGFGGFCSGPILGSVLTVAAADGSVVRGGALLATYALGSVAPLFLLAMFWDRLKLGERRWVRGRGFQIGPIAVHSTQLIAGVVFILLGVFFILLQGTSALAGTYQDLGFTELSFDVDVWVKSVTDGIPDALLFAVVGVVAAAVFWYVRRRLGPSDPASELGDEEAVSFADAEDASPS